MKHNCESCKLCLYAQKRPESIIGKIWRWHSKWCPLHKAQQKKLAQQRAHNQPSTVSP